MSIIESNPISENIPAELQPAEAPKPARKAKSAAPKPAKVTWPETYMAWASWAVLIALAVAAAYAALEAKDEAKEIRGRLSAVAGEVAGINTRVSSVEAVAKAASHKGEELEKSVATLRGRADAADQRVGQAEKAMAALKGAGEKIAGELEGIRSATAKSQKASADALAAAKAANGASEAAKAARSAAEYRGYMVKLAYIRGAAPETPLAKMSDDEVSRQLRNGKLDIEPQLDAEYGRLQAEAAANAKAALAESVKAVEAAANSKAVEAAAKQALDAGETALSAVGMIAESKAAFGGIKKSTRKSISEEVADYNNRHHSNE